MHGRGFRRAFEEVTRLSGTSKSFLECNNDDAGMDMGRLGIVVSIVPCGNNPGYYILSLFVIILVILFIIYTVRNSLSEKKEEEIEVDDSEEEDGEEEEEYNYNKS